MAEVADAAQANETGALYNTKVVKELKRPSTILEEAGKKLEVREVAKGATEEVEEEDGSK